MVTPNPQGRDRQSTRCSTISRPKSDASRPCDGVTVAPQRRCDGATERGNTVSASAVETAIVSLVNRPTASEARRGSLPAASG